ncbi:hypothetical protein QCA50_007841 [Cerrena zonata]|uniref:DUF6534 domain-containing protein n=1 Tax=Cerrena zonata TaxID=2478898 RepID=A0AAW0GDC5_9APHY
MLFTEDVLAFFVQSFYVWRIWHLSGRSITLIGILVLILILRIGSVIATAVFSIKLGVWDGFEPDSPSSIIALVSVALSAALDGLIACGMIYYLWSSHSGLMKTAGVTRWLMAYCVNTNLLNVLVAIVIAVTYAKLSHSSMMFLGWISLVSKLYSNAFLGTLNARHLMRQNLNRGIDKTDVELPYFRSATDYGPGTVQSAPAETNPSTLVISNEANGKILDVETKD